MSNNDRLHEHEDDLSAAFRSVRETYDGTNVESDATLQRALFRTRARERKQRVTRWFVVPIAAALVVSTAWAGVTGKLTPAVRSVVESLYPERDSRPAVATQPAPSSLSPSIAKSASSHSDPTDPSSATSAAPADSAATTVPSDAPNVAMNPGSTPQPVVPAVASGAGNGTGGTSSTKPGAGATGGGPGARSTPPAPAAPSGGAGASRTAATTVASGANAGVEPGSPDPTANGHAPPAGSAPDPHAALFAEAHRLHFVERDPARALTAWDRYLTAAPNGRFTPEARYNRALTLVRLNRHDDARRELETFANGAYGPYRRAEAKALLEALSADASRP